MGQHQTRLAVAGALALALCTGTAEAQENALLDLPPHFVQLRAGIAIEQVIDQSLRPIREFDLDANGLDAADIGTAESVEAAMQRSNQVSRTLQYDLDGNGKVTAEEIRGTEAFLRLRRTREVIDNQLLRAMMQKRISEILILDLDHDGSVSIEEMLSAEDIDAVQRKMTYESLRRLLLIDPNGDGRLTPAEMEALVRAGFAKLDADHDGVIDTTEHADYLSAVQQNAATGSAATCKLPKAGAGERVTAIGMYDAQAQPTVTVTGQDDVTFLARIVIEPGAAPLYLVLNAYDGMIWKFEGAIDRLKHVVVLPSESAGTDGKSEGWAGAGVTGLPKELVTFTAQGACGDYFYDPESESGKAMERRIAKAAGVTEVNLVGDYSSEGFSVPSGKPISPQKDHDIVITGNDVYLMTEGEQPIRLEGGLTLQAQEETMSKSGGIVDVKPEEVLAPGKVETYQVIPGPDGLRYMVQQGILQRTDKGYRLLKPMPRWPAGISGAKAVAFILPNSMPRPKGSLGHSTVVTEP